MLIDRVQGPLIVVFLIVSVACVAWATKQHGKLGPLVVVVLGSVAVVVGRVVWSVSPALYVGVVCLVAGSVWNLTGKPVVPVLKLPRRKLVSPVAADNGSVSS